MATSTKQVVPLTEVYDYYLAPGDPASAATSKGKLGRTVKVTLQYDKALSLAPDPIVWVAQEAVYTTLTDANGFWHVFLVPNNKISPANTYYTVEIEGGPSYQIQVTDVGVPGVGWQSSAPGILLNIPAALAPTTSTVGAITATGLITAQAGILISGGGLTVTGGETDTGGLTVDTITFSTAVSRIIAGGTSFAIRDNANANDNLLVTNAGNVTVRGSLTVTAGPLNVTAGGLSVTAGDLNLIAGNLVMSATNSNVIPGATALRFFDHGFANVNLNITDAGVVTVRGGLTVTAGGLTVTAGGETITAGNLTITAGNLLFGAATAKLIPGATGFQIRNNADSATQIDIPNSGAITLRNSLTIPTAQDGAPAATSFGTVPVKFAETLLGSAAASVSFTSIPSTFRNFAWAAYVRGDTAAVTTQMFMRVNNISTTTYDVEQQNFSGTVTAAPSEVLGTASPNVATLPANTATANYFGAAHGRIHMYAGTTGNKVWTAESCEARADTTGNLVRTTWMGKWRTTGTAINRVDFFAAAGNFVAASYWGIQLEP